MAVAVVACALAVVEAATRGVLYRASKDIARFADYPGRGARLARAPGLRVALVGNSATQRGVDAEALATALAARRNGPVAVETFVADGSKVKEWYYVVKRFVANDRAGAPDAVVLNFFDRCLLDDHVPEVGRLAQQFAAPGDWPEVIRTDLPGWSERRDFVVGSAWASYASSDRIRARVLNLIVPDYKAFSTRVNEAALDHLRRTTTPDPPAAAGRRALERLMDYARGRGVTLVFVAFPTLPAPGKPPYEVDPAVVRAIEAAGHAYLDLRRVDGLTPAQYDDDETHLGPEGRAIYSARLAEELSSVLARLPARR